MTLPMPLRHMTSGVCGHTRSRPGSSSGRSGSVSSPPSGSPPPSGSAGAGSSAAVSCACVSLPASGLPLSISSTSGSVGGTSSGPGARVLLSTRSRPRDSRERQEHTARTSSSEAFASSWRIDANCSSSSRRAAVSGSSSAPGTGSGTPASVSREAAGGAADAPALDAAAEGVDVDCAAESEATSACPPGISAAGPSAWAPHSARRARRSSAANLR
mmetsp:Transcript_42426/g.117404  ORF Transcript_42426/g.117404 Transcript_42426/m.117404 type:complete len:216 (-) Transcript_42426:351-998(-)